MLEEMEAYKEVENNSPQTTEHLDDFLLTEGFELLAAFRAIRSKNARLTIIKMIAAVAAAEQEAGTP